jgi:hypothetical protein
VSIVRSQTIQQISLDHGRHRRVRPRPPGPAIARDQRIAGIHARFLQAGRKRPRIGLPRDLNLLVQKRIFAILNVTVNLGALARELKPVLPQAKQCQCQQEKGEESRQKLEHGGDP